MTALSANSARNKKDVGLLREIAVAVKASQTIYKGAMICWDSTGDGVPAADTADYVFAGVSRDELDNSSGSDGVIQLNSVRAITVETASVRSYAVNGATPTPGKRAYVYDDNTVSAAATTNLIDCGVFVEPDPLNSGNWFVDHSQADRAGQALGVAAQVSFSAAAGAANVTEVTITVEDSLGNAIAHPHEGFVWLSDAATGAGLTGTTASGTVQAKSASGADFGALTAKKALTVQTLATGIYILEITDTAKTGFYVGANFGGVRGVSSQLVTGDYGS